MATAGEPGLAGAPTSPVALPSGLAGLFAGRPAHAVWVNELGGVTFEVDAGEDRWFAKWAPAGSGLDLEGEASRARWAIAYAVVPRVLETGADEDGSWLLTEALPGSNAVAARWKEDPGTAVAAIGEGLRVLHEGLPVARCPFSWSAQGRLAVAEDRADNGLLDPASWHADHRGLTTADALAVLREPPDVDQLVVCHADACAPNTLIGADGRCSGHVDLGRLGTADRWADLAVATWSTTWNYGPGWEAPLLRAYGVAPDAERTRYYRLLWDLT